MSHICVDFNVRFNRPNSNLKNFVSLFSRVVFINLLILAEITSRIRNWHKVKL